MFARSLGWCKSSDDKVIGLLCFDLDPMFRTRLLIFAFFKLRNDALKTTALYGFEELDATIFHVIGKSNPSGVGLHQLLENCLAIDQRKLHQVVTVDVEQ